MRHKNKEEKNRKWQVKSLRVLALFTFTFCLSTVSAQVSINATGGEATGAGGLASYSVGQVVYTTNTGTNGSVAQGVQQPYEIFTVTNIEEAKSINLTFSVYPNPTTDYLTLSIDASAYFDYAQHKSLSIQSMAYQLYDIQGKLLQNESITSDQTNIVMSNLKSSTYFIKVIKNNKEVKTFKIIKN